MRSKKKIGFISILVTITILMSTPILLLILNITREQLEIYNLSRNLVKYEIFHEGYFLEESFYFVIVEEGTTADEALNICEYASRTTNQRKYRTDRTNCTFYNLNDDSDYTWEELVMNLGKKYISLEVNQCMKVYV